MRVLGNGAYVSATLRRGQGITTNFRTLLIKQRQLSCWWRKVIDITAARLERARGGGTVLVDDDQHMYLMTYDLALVVPNCPTSYWRTKARDPKVRVAQRAVLNLDEEERSLELSANEIPPAVSTDT